MEERYIFFGRVLPERVPMSFEMQEIEIRSDLGIIFNISASVHKNQAVCNVSILNGKSDIFTIRNLVENALRVWVDLIGYHMACRFSLEITSAVWGMNERLIFGIDVPVLSQHRPKLTELRTGQLDVVAAEPAAQSVLADFREAIGHPVLTGLFLYRAVETMMQAMKESESEKADNAWRRFRETLCVSRDAIDFLKKHADPPRHGKIHQISDKDRAALFLIADELIRRYLAFLEGGQVPLSPSEHPLLREQPPD